MSSVATPHDTVSELRRAFDHTFAVSPGAEEDQEEELLAIRIAGNPYSLRRSQINGLARIRRIIPVPSRIPQLAGVIGFRALVVPVFHLADFVECRRAGNSPQWLAVIITEAVLGLGFDELDGLVSVPAHCLYQQGDGHQAGPVRQVAHIGAAVRPILEVPIILEQVRAAAQRKGSAEL